jgi:hypothetical protein
MTTLKISSNKIQLETGDQVHTFEKDDSGAWHYASVTVRGVVVARPVSREDSFFLGGGLASHYRVLENNAHRIAIAFTLPAGEVVYRLNSDDRLPLLHVAISGPHAASVAFRTPQTDARPHGAWITRGETAADAENREVFIDGTGPVVLGHSKAGNVDTAYVFIAKVNPHVQPNGRTEQRSNTHFKSGQIRAEQQRAYGYWQLRMGEGEPKECAVLFDRDLGGRVHHVCEKYYADIVSSFLDFEQLRFDYDPYRALEKMPLRHAAPDAFVPGYGWTMEEYPNAAYPYGHESSLQIGCFLVYEGHATQRLWERNFGKYILDKTPILGKDGTSYFVRRDGGVTRWGYFSDYAHPFPRLDGGNWGASEALYTAARIAGDDSLKEIALDMMRHDIWKKLNLDTMNFAPCWDVERAAPGDHRDDWAITTLLAYSAEICSQVLYPETKDTTYLKIADRICAWFKEMLEPEDRMNYLHEGVNMYNCWIGWIPRALIHKYERSGDTTYLDIAKDLIWVQILTLGITLDKDPSGQPFTGVTCVGVRGCIDYDCAPNLCQEKDLVFVEVIGDLLTYAEGPAYATYLVLQRLALPRDRWNDAFGVQELRDLNLRTMYDTYARGMANLIYALERSEDGFVVAADQTVSLRCLDIVHHRRIVLANATRQTRKTRLQIRYLAPGTYRIRFNGHDMGTKTHAELEDGLWVSVPAGSTSRIEVKAIVLERKEASAPPSADTITYLSDLTEADSQRGVGLPQPVFTKDRSFNGGPIALHGQRFAKGLGCAANTVILYRLHKGYRRFQALIGIDDSVAKAKNPPPSVNFTVFVDGVCMYDSGPVYAHTIPKAIDIDVVGAETLLLRVSDNWDNDGQRENDLANWADAKLIGGKHA